MERVAALAFTLKMRLTVNSEEMFNVVSTFGNALSHRHYILLPSGFDVAPIHYFFTLATCDRMLKAMYSEKYPVSTYSQN